MPNLPHSVTIPTEDNKPAPVGELTYPEEEGPSPENPLNCEYPCTVPGHVDVVLLIWDGTAFTLPFSESNDPNYGQIDFTYDPPLTA